MNFSQTEREERRGICGRRGWESEGGAGKRHCRRAVRNERAHGGERGDAATVPVAVDPAEQKLPWPSPLSSQVREKEFAGERGRCCAAVRCCSATATPCRHRSYHRHVPPPLLTAEGKPCLRCCLSRRTMDYCFSRCWFTVRKRHN
ncbi:uncharacterized protein LOC110271605 [Arachis ipaensis]|uniref:uncharacterized protein LOC110271605 n=1 Tax=Arachis ipaensis TaxID=130454 RepID=UPI000A2B0403|nr:uncharacterized protein LOC110271605 [Arachis ipaensis]